MRAEEWLMLGLVIERPSHGYEISRRYHERYGSLAPLSRSSVYELLDRLRRGGLIARTVLPMTRRQHRLRRSFRATRDGVAAYERHYVANARSTQHADDHQRERFGSSRGRVPASPRPVPDAPARRAPLDPSPGEGFGLQAEAGAFELLGIRQEGGLARAVDDGRDAARRLEQSAARSASARIALERVERGGEQAERRLFAANMRVVVEVAHSFRGRGLDVEELVQIGTFELTRALETYDPGERFRFSQHVRSRVRQALAREIAGRGRLVRLPQSVTDQIKSLALTARLLERERGREPSARELSGERGLEQSEVALLRELAREPISLGVSLSSALDGAITGGAAAPEATVEEQLIAGMLAPDVRRALLHLKPRARHVLVRRHGLDGREPQTLRTLALDSRARSRTCTSSSSWPRSTCART